MPSVFTAYLATFPDKMSFQPELPKKIKGVILIGNHKILTKFSFLCIQCGVEMSFTEFVFLDPSDSHRHRQRRVSQNSGEYLRSGEKRNVLLFQHFQPKYLAGSQTVHSGQTPPVSEAPNRSASRGLWSAAPASQSSRQSLGDPAHHQLDPVALRGGRPGVAAEARSVRRLHRLLLGQHSQTSLHCRLREGHEASFPRC